jgi:hypothetical protein
MLKNEDEFELSVNKLKDLQLIVKIAMFYILIEE